MRKKLLIAMLFFATVSTTLYLPTNVSASTTVKKNEFSFNKAWENTVYIYSDSAKKKEVGKMVYGFDTVAVNEDYCWTRIYSEKHQAGICNDKGCFYTFVKGYNRWAKKEINHKGKEVEYSCWMDEYTIVYTKMKYDTDMK